MSIQSMQDLYVHGLKDIYYAEKQILKALPKLAKKVGSSELREALEHHLEETKGQVERLEAVFKECGVKASGEKCPGIEGLIEEGEKIVSETKDEDVLTAAILSDAQAVEHYEISRYGTLGAWAKQLGYEKSARLLEETLEEEKNADKILSRIALKSVNRKAAA